MYVYVHVYTVSKPESFLFLSCLSIVKPVAVSELVVLAENGLIEAQWMPPGGPVPEQCLEYELEGTTESLDGSKWQVQTSTTQDPAAVKHVIIISGATNCSRALLCSSRTFNAQQNSKRFRAISSL